MNYQHDEINKALDQLKILGKDTGQDRRELKHILFEILGYPSVAAAEQHHRANSVGCNDLFSRRNQINEDIKNKRIQNLEVCQCCGLFVNNQELPYCVDFKELNLGVGVLLFFRNYLFNCWLFMLMFLVYSIYAIVTNTDLFQASDKEAICSLSGSSCRVAEIGADEQKNLLSLIQSILALAFVSLWGIINLVKKHLDLKMEIEMEVLRVSAPDFSVMLTHCPLIYLSQSYEQNLKNLNQVFKVYQKTVGSHYSYEVVKYNVAHPLYARNRQIKQEVEQLESQLQQKLEVFRQWVRHRQNHKNFPVSTAQRYRMYDDYIFFFCQELETISANNVPLGVDNPVFVTLRYSKAMEEIVKDNRAASCSNLWNLCNPSSNFPVRGVKIRKAPEPEQIKWEKIGFSSNSKLLRKLLIWLVTAGLIGVSLGISISIAFVDTSSLNRSISIAISLVITAINVGIQLVIMKLSYLENQHISSCEQFNVVLKIGVGQLINSIGVPILITVLSNNDPSVANKTWLQEGGLVSDVFYIALFNIAVPFGRLLDPYELLLKLQRWYYKTPLQRLKIHGQKSLNKYYGNHTFDIGYEYAYLIKTSIFTAFFACMQPIIVLFASCGLFMYYLADRRNLLRHLQRPNFHSSDINKIVDLFLLFSPIAFGFGHLLVNNFINEAEGNGTLLINWIIVIVAGIFAVMGIFDLFYKCIKKPQYPDWDYLKVKPLIPTDYDRENPVTRNQAITQFQHYLQELEAKQQLPDQSNLINSRLFRPINHNQSRASSMKQSLMWLNNQSQGQKIKSRPKYNNDINLYNEYISRNQEAKNSDHHIMERYP